MKVSDLKIQYPRVVEAMDWIAYESHGTLNPHYQFQEGTYDWERMENALSRLYGRTLEDVLGNSDVLEDMDRSQSAFEEFVCGEDRLMDALTKYLGGDGQYTQEFLEDVFLDQIFDDPDQELIEFYI